MAGLHRRAPEIHNPAASPLAAPSRPPKGVAADIKANVPKLAKLRRQVQLAADQVWPWRTPGVATIRKAFLLSPDRPMKD
jgi:hypothetical protein